MNTAFFAAIDIEEIIDHLHEEKVTLCACSLVCRAWLTPSRYHLFGELDLPARYGKDEALLELIDSEDENYIVPFIRSIHFYNIDSEYFLDPLSDLLYVLYDSATGLKSLSFTRYHLFVDDLRQYFHLDRITELDITKSSFQSFDELIDLFSALPCLEKLIIDRNDVSGFATKFPPNRRHVVLTPKLHDIEVYAWMVKLILPLLAPSPTLRMGKFCILDTNELSIVRDFLGATAPRLDDFSLTYCGNKLDYDGRNVIERCMQNIDFSAFPLLCSFKFMMGDAVTFADIPIVLEKITSPMINHIKLGFVCNAVPEEGVWRTLPGILAGPNFQQLRTLEFDIDKRGRRADHEQMEKMIRAELHMVTSRGIEIRLSRHAEGLYKYLAQTSLIQYDVIM